MKKFPNLLTFCDQKHQLRLFCKSFLQKGKDFWEVGVNFHRSGSNHGHKKTRKISKKSQKGVFSPKIRVSPIFCWSYDFETMRKRVSTSNQVYIGHWLRLETDLVYPYTQKMRNSHVCSDIRCYTSNINYLEILVYEVCLNFF